MSNYTPDLSELRDEGLECIECGTTWGRDGTMGETDE